MENDLVSLKKMCLICENLRLYIQVTYCHNIVNKL